MAALVVLDNDPPPRGVEQGRRRRDHALDGHGALTLAKGGADDVSASSGVGGPGRRARGVRAPVGPTREALNVRRAAQPQAIAIEGALAARSLATDPGDPVGGADLEGRGGSRRSSSRP